MNIGVIVDGKAEFKTFPVINGAIRQVTGHNFVGVALADTNAAQSVDAIAYECERRAPGLIAKRADRIIVVLDREDNWQCCGDIADAIAIELGRRIAVMTSVVLKNNMFENWLISDLNALRAQPGRFQVSRGLERAVHPNRADYPTDASRLIRRATRGDSYDKVPDAERIIARATVGGIAENSRSFRRYLRCAGHPDYADQSRSCRR